jgi:Lamin Tail Domain/Right handed beta helix region
MHTSKSLIIALIIAATVVLPAGPSNAAPAIEIESIVYNPGGKDTGTNSHLNKEKIIVRNLGDRTINLRGWRISDSDGKKYRFGSFNLAADSKVVLHSGRGHDTRRDLYWDRGRYVWHNKADVARLMKAGGGVVDRCRYGGGGRSTTCASGSGGGGAVEIEPGADIQTAIDANPAGTKFLLSGNYTISTTILPKPGNRFVGPATIVGAGAEVAFEAKTGSGGAADVRFIDLDVSGFVHGIDCWDGTHVIGGRYHDNSRNGIGCGLEGGDVLIDGVEVDHNGSQADLGSGASGLKFANGHGIVVRNSYIHDNLGNGVWCDQQCGDFTVIDNRIIHNSRKGVHYEKSGESDLQGITFIGAAYIARNVVQGNGWEGRQYADAGIAAVSSKNILIEDNVLGGNAFANGIKIIQDDRLTGDAHGWVVSNVVIGSNAMNGDNVVGCDSPGVDCS